MAEDILFGLEKPSPNDYPYFLQNQDLGPWGPRTGYVPINKTDAERYMALRAVNIYRWNGRHWALQSSL